MGDTIIRTGYICPVSAGGRGFGGGAYDINGHPVGHSGALCGTWIPDTPTVSISGVTVTEGGRAVVTITSSGGSDSGSVDFATANGSAVAPGDYTATSGRHTFSSSQLSKQVTVSTTDDSDVENSESFTVVLSNPQGVDIGTGTATVTILDNDIAPSPCPAGQTGTPPNCVPIPLPCPAGQTGTPPNCVPIGTPPCPAGQTGTPPNCVPVVVGTGCDAPGTRLAALSVTDGGVEVLSGFDPGTYSYAVTIDGLSARIDAAADSQALIVSGQTQPSAGSLSRTTLLNEGGTSNISVRVASSGQSCTYTLSITRTGTPVQVPACAAWSGMVLVGGVCVPACSSEDHVPDFQTDGQAGGCIFVGNCPFSLWGYNPSGPFELRFDRFRDFPARWVDDDVALEPLPAGGTATTVRHAVKCNQIFRLQPWTSNTHRCTTREVNLHPLGDCLRFRVSVKAVVPGTSDDSGYSWDGFVSSGCGNASAPDEYAALWTADDYVCLSSEGSWTPGMYCSSSCSTDPAADVGVWSVTMGDLTDPLLDGSTASPYVDVPLEVEVSDWGVVSELEITVSAISRVAEFWSYPAEYGYYTSWPASGSSTRVVVRRLSGPAPSDDVVRVNLAEIAELSYFDGYRRGLVGNVYEHVANGQFVDILRDDLLANDACPVGADCTDPNRWPVRLVGTDLCNIAAFQPHRWQPWRMQPTELGLVGCSDLNETGDPTDPASVQYWPRLWALGTDTFSYSTYGGTATVTVEFTDQPPAGGDIVVHDPGVEHTVAFMDGTLWRTQLVGCIVCHTAINRYTVDYTRTSDVSTSHYAGAVPLDSVRDGDPDGDIVSVAITDGHNPHLTGQSGFHTGGVSEDFSLWSTDDTSPNVPSCWYYGTCAGTPASRYVSFVHGGLLRLVNPADGMQVQQPRSSVCLAHADTTARVVYDYSWPNAVVRWSAPTDTDPGCLPSVPDECGVASLLADWTMCYSLWPNANNPAPLVVDYRACDARIEEATGSSFAAYLTPLIASSLPNLTETRIAYLIQHRTAGNSNRPRPVYAGWPYTDTQADWDALVAIIDLQLGSRYCGSGTITVLLGDSSTVSIQPATTASEGSSLGFAVTLDEAAAIDVVVTFSTEADVGGTHPASSSDYLARAGAQVTIPAGDTTTTAYVSTIQDSIHEYDETLKVVIASATGARLGTVVEAVGTITNDDAMPEVGLDGDVTVDEDASVLLNPPFDIDGDGIADTEYIYGETMRFTVRLVGESDLPVTVGYNTETTPGTATSAASCASYPGSAAEDYRPESGTLTFTPGDTSETITVTLCPDDQHEGNETLTVTLSGVSGASLDPAGGAAAGTINDNDGGPPEVSLAGPVSAQEGSALLFEVQLQEAAPADVTVTVSNKADPAATHPADPTGTQRDYQPRSRAQVTIPAGSLSQTARVFTSADTADEYDETLLLNIDSVASTVGGEIGTVDTAVGTIVDNDGPPVISVGDASAGETGTITFDVTLSAASRKTVTVAASTGPSSPLSAAGTAAACSAVDGSEDYQTRMVLITYPPGATTAAVAVTVCDDTATEPDETFTMTLSAAANATISATAGVGEGVIADDDAVVCEIWQQLDPVTSLCVMRTFFS